MAGRRRRRRGGNPVPPAALDTAGLTELQRRARQLDRQAAREAAAQRPDTPPSEQLARGLYVRRTVRRAHDEHAAECYVNTTQSAIDRYRARRQLDDRQHAAATKYRADYDRGAYERSIVGRYEGGGGSGAGSPNMSGLLAATVAQLDARTRFRAARAVLPRSLAGAFDAIVLHDDDARLVGEAGGRAGQLAARFALEWLRIGANELADFYRLD